MVIYQLIHTYYKYKNDFYYSLRDLGFYTDMENIEEAKKIFLTKPGYMNAPDAFIIRRREVTGEVRDNILYEAMMYAHTKDFEDYEYTEELGLFAEKEDAIEALERFKKDNVGFWRNNFLEIEEIVNKCILNKMCCVEGFDVVALEEEG